MPVVAPASAPTREDAERVAEVLVGGGVAEVLLFGSVAAGTAGPHSDIDLVAIYADVDYSERHLRQRELEAAAAAVVAAPVQIHVTDRPEWSARVERVSTSFECMVASEAAVLAVDLDDSPVDWGKEMVLPMSDPQEALHYFAGRVLPRLQGVATAATRSILEVDAQVSAATLERRRLNRLVSLCVDAALAAETSVKSMAKLYGNPTPTEKQLKSNGQTIATVLQRHVPEPQCGEMQAAFDHLGVDLGELSLWRDKGTYADNIDTVRADADHLASGYAAMASGITGLVVSHLRRSLGIAAADASAERDSLAVVIAGQDVRLGIPTQGGIDI